MKPIKETNGTYGRFEFAPIFSLKNLKQWIKQVETITEKNGINITENLTSIDKNPLDYLEKFFTFESSNSSVIGTIPKEPSLVEQPQQIAENEECVHNLNDKKLLAFVSYVHTGEPCYNNCGKMGQWLIEIDSDFKQLFCNECFKIAKIDLSTNGYEVQLKGLEAS